MEYRLPRPSQLSPELAPRGSGATGLAAIAPRPAIDPPACSRSLAGWSTPGRRRWLLLALAGLVAVLGSLLAPGSALASQKTWTGAFSPPIWSDSRNWAGGVPVAGDDLVFPASASNFTSINNLTAGTSFKSIKISSAGYNIVGNGITLGTLSTDGITNDALGGASTFALDIALTANRTITVTNSLATLVLSGAISGSGGGIFKEGAGTLEFAGSAANTYTGNTQVRSGTLNLHKPAGVDAVPGGFFFVGVFGQAATVRLLASDQIGSTTGIAIADMGVLDLNGFSETISGSLRLNVGPPGGP